MWRREIIHSKRTNAASEADTELENFKGGWETTRIYPRPDRRSKQNTKMLLCLKTWQKYANCIGFSVSASQKAEKKTRGSKNPLLAPRSWRLFHDTPAGLQRSQLKHCLFCLPRGMGLPEPASKSQSQWPIRAGNSPNQPFPSSLQPTERAQHVWGDFTTLGWRLECHQDLQPCKPVACITKR